MEVNEALVIVAKEYAKTVEELGARCAAQALTIVDLTQKLKATEDKLAELEKLKEEAKA